jgi:hypothetical protein
LSQKSLENQRANDDFANLPSHRQFLYDAATTFVLGRRTRKGGAQPMRISKIKISNFCNFSDFEVETGNNLVIVGGTGPVA